MQVQVLYFGVLKDILLRDSERMDLSVTASVEELLSRIRGTRPHHESLWNSVAVAVNQVYAKRDHLLREGDEVALLPPVSGGACRLEARA